MKAKIARLAAATVGGSALVLSGTASASAATDTARTSTFVHPS